MSLWMFWFACAQIVTEPGPTGPTPSDTGMVETGSRVTAATAATAATGKTGDTGTMRPPTLDVAIAPAEPVWGADSLQCAAVASVPDATFVWTDDDGKLLATGPVLDAALTVLGERFTCTVSAPDWTDGQATVAPAPARTNVLVLLADDVGIDRVSSYGVHPEPTELPRIDRLADEGIRFDYAYVTPLCSPTRAMLMSGRYNRTLGLGYIIDAWLNQYALPTGEAALPVVAAAGGYGTGFVGKWHMGSAFQGPSHPSAVGFDHHVGTPGNLADPPGAGHGYYEWDLDDNGTMSIETTYATTRSVDDALALSTTLTEPWLIFVSFNAPHSPYTPPPPELVGGAAPAVETADRYDQVLMALDTEIGRLVDGLGPMLDRTTVLFLGDNGTPEEAVRPPTLPDEAKGSLHEGGTRVPFIVRSPLVRTPGAHADAFVSGVDLLPTVAALAGVQLETILRSDGSPAPYDGMSVLPLLVDPTRPGPRTYAYTELFSVDHPDSIDGPRRQRDETWRPNGRGPYNVDNQALRNRDWKLIRHADHGTATEALYDLRSEAFETEDLLQAESLSPDAQLAYDELSAELDRRTSELLFDVVPGPPHVASLSLSPAEPLEGTDVTCIVDKVVDEDDSDVDVAFGWLVEGLPVGGGMETLSSTRFAAEDLVTCTVVPSDGQFVGVPVSVSASVAPTPEPIRR